MPVGGSNFNLIKGMADNIKVETITHDSNDKLTEKINMEAYQAYYNTNENSTGPNPGSSA